jgi:hypothetical protein
MAVKSMYSVTGVMKIWLDKYWYDFGKEEVLLHSMNEYLTFLSSVPGSERTAETLKKTLDKKKELGDQRVGELVTTQPPPRPFLPTAGGPIADVLDINSEELARQICITEFELFEKLRPWEFIGQAWAKAGKEQKAPNLLKIIDRFNTVSSWAISEICRCESLKRRGKVLLKIIEIAGFLRQYNNYNSLMAFIAALNNASVSRLKQTFSQMPQKVTAQLTELNDLVSQLGNYAKLRNAIHSCTPPLVPYLGMYLTDLTFIDENANMTDAGLINFSKRRQIANVIQNEIAQYQQERYNLEPVPQIQHFLNNLQYFDDKTNYKLSTWIEPRQGTMRPQEKPVELMMGEEVRMPMNAANSGSLGSSTVVNGMSLNDDTEPIDLEFVQGYRFYPPDKPYNIKRSNDPNTGAVIVHAATVDKLIERLTHERLTEDASFLPTFLAAYRYFVTAYDLLDALIMRWYLPRPRQANLTDQWREKKEIPIKKRVLGVMNQWIERYYADFVDDPALWEKLSTFLDSLGNSDPQSASVLQTALSKAMQICQQNQLGTATGPGVPTSIDPPASVLQKSLGDVSIADLDATEVARQLCLISHAAFCQIRPSEAAYGRWRDNDTKMDYAPNLSAFFQVLFNLTANIDSELGRFLTRPHDLTAVISRWIEVAQICYQFNNWACMRAIVFGIDKAYAQELQAVWSQVSAPLRSFFADVRKIAFDSQLLRTKLTAALQSPQVPALDSMLAEVSFLEAQMPDWVFTPDPLVNFDKFNAIGALLGPAFAPQQQSYLFARVDFMQAWLVRPVTPEVPLISRIQNRVPIDESTLSASWTATRAAPSLRNLGGSGGPPGGPPAGTLPPLPGGPPSAILPPVPPPSSTLPPLPGGPPANALPPNPVQFNANPMPQTAPHNTPAQVVQQPPKPVHVLPPVGPKKAAMLPPLPKQAEPVTPVAEDIGSQSIITPEMRVAVLNLLRTSIEVRHELDQLMTDVMEESARQAEREMSVEAEAYENNRDNPHAEFYRVIQREFPGCKITKWTHNDKQGVVYGFPDQIECDMIKRGDDTFLCDIRPEVQVQNVALLLRIGKLYRTLNPKGSLSCVVVAKEIHPRALTVAQKCKIKIFRPDN